MDIYRLSEDLKLVNQIGATLNIEEKLNLELSLLKINESEKFDQILFWGKIEGVSKDYYIALGLNFRGQYEFPLKKFFWSSNNFKFAELPAINQEYKDKVDTFLSLFSGQHEKILIQIPEVSEGGGNKSQQPPEESEDDEDKEIKIPPQNFTELDRLAYVVRAIDIECSLVPVGAFKLTPTHELRYNDSFKGLTMCEAQKPGCYQHFRNPQTEEKKEFIARDEALFHFNFLDPIEKDLPKGCWSIQSDSSKTNVTIRSLLWPGYVAYHRINSNRFGGAYFGNGVKNIDLPFLL